MRVLIRLLFWWHRRPSDTVSARWLQEHARDTGTQGIDGVVWRWPISKICNEAAQFNAQRLRRRG